MSEVIKFKGIVLKELAKGESDKSITVLAKGLGLIRLSAKGAKNTKSRFMAGAQAFAYCDFVCYAGKNFYSLNEITLINSFYNIRLDYHKISAAFYFCEITEKTLFPNSPCDEILLLLLKTFLTLAKSDFNLKLLTAVFELKFLVLNGFTPELHFCVVCGQEAAKNLISPQAGGVVCSRHGNVRALKLEKGTYLAIQYIIQSDVRKLYSFTVDENVLQNLFVISKQFFRAHLDIQLQTENFIIQ